MAKNMSKRLTTVSEAIRILRAHYGESQVDFSKRVGIHYVTLCRYERSKEPTGSVLARLQQLAEKKNQAALAKTFKDALYGNGRGRA